MLQTSEEFFRTQSNRNEIRHNLARYLDKIGEIEEKVEATKSVLMENPNFDLRLLFATLADQSSNRISRIGLRRFFEQNQISLQSESINLLFSSMDRDKDGSINFRDFSYSLLGNPT